MRTKLLSEVFDRMVEIGCATGMMVDAPDRSRGRMYWEWMKDEDPISAPDFGLEMDVIEVPCLGGARRFKFSILVQSGCCGGPEDPAPDVLELGPFALNQAAAKFLSLLAERVILEASA